MVAAVIVEDRVMLGSHADLRAGGNGGFGERAGGGKSSAIGGAECGEKVVTEEMTKPRDMG